MLILKCFLFFFCTETEGELTRLIKTLPWGPLYCVLQQDDQTFTAYCSEEISVSTPRLY